MFDLKQTIYYMRDNRVHSAPILSRMVIENAHEDWANTDEQKEVFCRFGYACVAYSTVHGVVYDYECAASREDLLEIL